MKSNNLSALSIEAPLDNIEFDSAIQFIHADAELDAEVYVKSAKVDLGGE